MGLFRRKAKSAPTQVASPVTGKVVPLSDVPDPVVVCGMLGPGCGVWPEDDTVVAPCDGTVIATTKTNHAIGVQTPDGVEVLLHVGVDTVEMGGDGFACFVEEGDRVRKGQKLITFDRDKCAAAGHPDIVAVLFTGLIGQNGRVSTVAGPHVGAGDALLEVSPA